MRLSRPPAILLIPALAAAGLVPLQAEQAGVGSPAELRRTGVASVTAADEERDAREIADRINAALNLRQEVTVTLLNDTAVVVNGKVTTQRYWLIITDHDGSEFRFRAALIATVKIK